ncbi:unnamed protein product [Didymodactylos carnosus]|uniref:NAD(P)(+)--arginine ADP-ribosyltransferase n=1 Tax=Didymodactylos carnosus TaxID=1234261 RepID=A0A815C7L9_9BILA|nr:unnamed protein product [Didymodactylos carnosus]CAF4075104.1 unnamed protein product [Didymodactylos carnosus]
MQEHDRNFETFALVLLHSNSDDSYLELQQKLREIVNYVRTFIDIDTCEQWLKRRETLDDKIVFIVTDTNKNDILPRIFKLPQIDSIYLYSQGESTMTSNHHFTNDYADKIRGVITDSDDLIHKILDDQKYRENRHEATIVFHSVNSTSITTEKSSSELDGNFLWSQLFIEALLRMPATSTLNNRKELIALCKQIYAGNAAELRLICLFEQTYSPQNAVRWYTKSSFVYRILNKALRVQDIETLIAFRFFIIDLYQQLKHLQQSSMPDKPITTVYRGQLISRNELNGLKSTVGQYLSFNSFLSTTREVDVAMLFVSHATDNLQPVLFEIEVPSNINSNAKPYADISSETEFGIEREVLFMLGSICKVIDVKDDQIMCKVKLELRSEDDSQLKQLSDYLKNHLAKETSLYHLGYVLREMGKYGSAMKCYAQQLKEIEDKSSNEAGLCYQGLGGVACLTKHYDLSIPYLRKALEIQQTFPDNEHNISSCWNNLANTISNSGDYELGLDYFCKSLEIRKSLPGHHLEVATSYYNIAHTYSKQEKYEKALENFLYALDIQKQHLPANHYQIAQTLMKIGAEHGFMNQYETAFKYFQQADKIYRHSLPSTHTDVIHVKQAMEAVQEVILKDNSVPSRETS